MSNRYILAALIGLVAGITGGLFGIGGGIVVVPGLILFLGLLPHRAHPTSGAAIVVTAGAALSRFAVDGSVDWPTSLALFAGAGIGAVLGARVIDRISAEWLTWVFVSMLVVSAVRLLIPDQAMESESFVASIDLTLGALAGLLAIGAVAGLLAATLGVGGGIVFVPTLAALYAVDQHVAQGTSLAAMVPTTIVAAVVHGRAGRIDWRVSSAVGVGGIIGGLAGAELALGLDPLLLRRLFAGLLVLAAIRMLAGRGRRSRVQEQTAT
ncbi:MAG: sulfite exporter TauE/SafE family protein [Acidimicrobiia bacterium]|nr:sulfite exporter TauE/SafE family protein [Acidimicrobiia bacterium]MDH3396623.1 sulfite exporter TauE/SafE family protein [Acidimicrobiia bacterium]